MDPHRIDAFLSLYKTDQSLTENERMTLGILIIGSFDDALNDEIFSEDLWHDAWATLKENFALHAHTFDYWAHWEEDDLSNCFAISEKLRMALTTS